MATTRKKNEVETSAEPQTEQVTEVVETPAQDTAPEGVEQPVVEAAQPEVQPTDTTVTEVPQVTEETEVPKEIPLTLKWDHKPGVYRTATGAIVERF